MMVTAAQKILLVEAKEILSYIAAVFGRKLSRFDLWKYSRWQIHPFPALRSRPGRRPRLAAWSDEVDRWCLARGWGARD
jgi:hypothetical protein